jgi:hypothetical protein
MAVAGPLLTFSSEFVDQLALPVEHDVFLVLHGFLLLSVVSERSAVGFIRESASVL